MADGQQPAKVAFGFTATTKKKQKVSINIEDKTEHRQLITGVEGARIQAAEPDQPTGKQYVVPKLENTYRAGPKKFTPTFKPPSSDNQNIGSTDDKFEAAVLPLQSGITTYGLELRGRKAEEAAAAAAADQGGTGNGHAAGGGEPNVVARLAADKEGQQLQEDLEALPEQATMEDYDALPVEEFGMALLRGLGWKEGEGVGRKRHVVEPTQIVRRPERLGLGANPAKPPPDTRPKIRKMGDKVEPRPEEMVLPPDADGRQRHLRKLDEKLVHRSTLELGPRPGKAMKVVGGRHEGLVCQVLELLPVEEGRSARARVRLHPSGETVDVRCTDLGERGAAPAAAAEGGSNGRAAARDRQRDGSREGRHRPHDEGGSGRDERGSERGSERERERRREHHEERGERGSRQAGRSGEREHAGDGGTHHYRSNNSQQRDGGSDKRHHSSKQRRRSSDSVDGGGGGGQRIWLAPNIRVRIVDKGAGKGKLYLKKGTVVDVHPGGKCDVSVDESRAVVLLPQSSLETVVPKQPGSAVLVVAGEFRGQRAKLLQSGTAGGAAAVQLMGDLSVQRLMLDDMAAYVGPLDVDEDHY